MKYTEYSVERQIEPAMCQAVCHWNLLPTNTVTIHLLICYKLISLFLKAVGSWKPSPHTFCLSC